MKKQTPKTTPFSIRLTAEEKDTIKQAAGTKPVGAYVRSRLLGENVATRHKTRRPGVDQKKFAFVLAELGKTRLASNMNQIARAANAGALPVTRELVEELHAACADIRSMRFALIEALGIKPEDGN